MLAYTEAWDVLGYNDGFAAIAPEVIAAGNILRWFFTPSARRVVANWDIAAARLMARTRYTHGLYQITNRIDTVLDDVCQHDQTAKALWTHSPDVGTEPSSVRYQLRTADSGLTTVTVVSLQPAGARDPSIRFVVFLTDTEAPTPTGPSAISPSPSADTTDSRHATSTTAARTPAVPPKR